jgi:sigma-B regulation protein RsbU (phosphoserine phosphatase)
LARARGPGKEQGLTRQKKGKKALNPLAAPIPRTLIADDQPDVLAALRLLLKGAGYQTEAVTSPSAVLEAIKHRKFDLVLMDLNYARDTTSGKEGLDLISRIQALDSILPIVVMTAWGTVDLAVETMRRGGRDFVQKPWDNSRLLQTLRTQIEQGRARRRMQRRDAESQMLNHRLRLELEEAGEIQQGLLPKELPKLTGFELASAWQPAHTVSGDYLEAFKLDHRHAALCIADVSGKGLPAALLMSNMQAALKSAAAASVAPSDLCARVNRVMCANTPENRFITCFYGVLDVHSRKLAFTNAGHNPPMLVRRCECIRLEEGGHVLGVFRDSHYLQSEVQFCPGDRLVLFTDGLTEATNANGEEFGEKRLRDLIVDKLTVSASELQQSIMNAVREFCGNEFHDDAALIVIAAR